MRKLDDLIKLLNLPIIYFKMIYWAPAINHVNVNHNHDRNTEMILSDGSAFKKMSYLFLQAQKQRVEL